MKIIIIPICALFVFNSCLPLQKLNRLQTRHPQLFEQTKDTVVHTDTISVNVPQIQLNTKIALAEITEKDTAELQTENGKISLWKVQDTIYIRAKTIEKTLRVPYRVEVPVTRYKVVEAPKKKPKNKNYMEWIAVIAIIAIINFTLYKIMKDE